MVSPICRGFSDSIELDSSTKFIIINNNYLMMRLRLLSEAPVKVFLVFLRLHSDKRMATFSSEACYTRGLKHMKRIVIYICRHHKMPFCQDHTIYNHTTGNQGLIEKCRSASGKTMVPKIPLWTSETGTELQLTTKELSGKIFPFIHFLSLILSLYISLVRFKL